jgi:hypothetical protein
MEEQRMESRTYGQREGRTTGMIESQTSRLPSGAYLGFAIGSIAASATFKILGRDEWSLFIGQWAPTFLILGLYNKLVKQLGTDAYTRAA